MVQVKEIRRELNSQRLILPGTEALRQVISQIKDEDLRERIMRNESLFSESTAALKATERKKNLDGVHHLARDAAREIREAQSGGEGESRIVTEDSLRETLLEYAGIFREMGLINRALCYETAVEHLTNERMQVVGIMGCQERADNPNPERDYSALTVFLEDRTLAWVFDRGRDPVRYEMDYDGNRILFEEVLVKADGKDMARQTEKLNPPEDSREAEDFDDWDFQGRF